MSRACFSSTARAMPCGSAPLATTCIAISTASGVSGSSSFCLRGRLRRTRGSSASATVRSLHSGTGATEIGPVRGELQGGIVLVASFVGLALAHEHVAPIFQRVGPVRRQLGGARKLHLRDAVMARLGQQPPPIGECRCEARRLPSGLGKPALGFGRVAARLFYQPAHPDAVVAIERGFSDYRCSFVHAPEPK